MVLFSVLNLSNSNREGFTAKRFLERHVPRLLRVVSIELLAQQAAAKTLVLSSKAAVFSWMSLLFYMCPSCVMMALKAFH